ncbi:MULTISPECIES: hypothetical protein [Oscillatoriales]|nr:MULTISPECIES: hypothetical protein [Oscillatoriales]
MRRTWPDRIIQIITVRVTDAAVEPISVSITETFDTTNFFTQLESL